MTILLALLRSKTFWIALIVSLFLAYLGILKVELRHKDAVIAEREAEIGKWKTLTDELNAKIVLQNNAVEAWKAAGIENSKRAVAAQSRIVLLQTKHKQEVQDILQTHISSTMAEVSPKDAKECIGAIQWAISESSFLSSW